MSSSCLTLTHLLGLDFKNSQSDKKEFLPKPNSNIFLVKNFCKQSEDIINESNITNLNNDNNVDFCFYEELREIEYLLNKIKKQIDILKHEKGFCKNNIFNNRSIDCLELNLNYLIQVIKLFYINKIAFYKNINLNGKNENIHIKENIFDDVKNNVSNRTNFTNKKIFSLQKMQIIRLYFFTIFKFKALRNKYGDFHYITIDEENRFINSIRKFFFLKEVLAKPSKMGLMYIRTLKFFLWKILKCLRDELSEKMNMIKLGFYVTKINFFCFLSADFLILKENNLFEKSFSDKRWKDIYSNLQIELVGGIYRAKTARYIANFSTTFINTVYYFTKFDKFRYSCWSLIKLGFSVILFTFFSKIRKYFRLFNTIHPNLNMTKLIFGTPEIGFINLYYSCVRERGLVEKSFSIIDYGRYFKYYPYWFKNLGDFDQSHKLKLVANFKNEFDEEFFSSQKNFIKNLNIIERMFKNGLKKDNQKRFKENFSEVFKSHSMNKPKLKKNMIFCLHGGGFIAQNTESHLGYYSHIIKDTDSFIISYDYKLAPENKLDKIIEDSIKAFEFIYFFSDKLFGIEIENYVLMGDSAGGLLSMNLINHIIRKNYRCRIIFDEMYPSNLFALTDLMIDTPFISQLMSINMKIEDYYSGKINLDERYDIFLTDKTIVEQYPKTFIVFGSTDPIRDESYKLGDFLLQNKVKTELKEFLFFNHGFMNISSFIDPYYLPAVDYIKDKIKDTFKNFD